MSAERSPATDEAAEVDGMGPSLALHPATASVYDPAAGTGDFDGGEGGNGYDPAAPLLESPPPRRRPTAGNGTGTAPASSPPTTNGAGSVAPADVEAVEAEPMASGASAQEAASQEVVETPEVAATGPLEADEPPAPSEAEPGVDPSAVARPPSDGDASVSEEEQGADTAGPGAAGADPPVEAASVAAASDGPQLAPTGGADPAAGAAADGTAAAAEVEPVPDGTAASADAVPEPAAGGPGTEPADATDGDGSPGAPATAGAPDGEVVDQEGVAVAPVEGESQPPPAPPASEPDPVGSSFGDTVVAVGPPVLSPAPVAGGAAAPVSAVPAAAEVAGATGRRRRTRRMIRSRKVRRVVRHIDPWSVLTFSVIFHLCLFGALLLAGALVWSAASASGTIENIESFVRDLGDYDTWEIQGDAMLRAGIIIAGMMTLASTVLVVLLTVVFNLISDLIGGIRVTVIEEEVHRVPVPARK